MKRKVEDFPLHELLLDRAASEHDIRICEKCLAVGITHHSDGFPVEERLKLNRDIIEAVNAELARRGKETVVVQFV